MVLAVFATIALSVVLPLLISAVAHDFGWGTFVVGPLAGGFAGALTLKAFGDYAYRFTAQMVGWSLAAGLFVTLVTLREGAVCVLMAAPILVPCWFAGASIGHYLASRVKKPGPLSASVLAVAPFVLVSLAKSTPTVWTDTATTAMVVDAVPDEVWPLISNLKVESEPSSWILRTGVAHPLAVETDGDRRVCRLSTGDMPETIVVSVPGKQLGFRVESTPPTMVETNPFGKVEAAHLSGYYQCRYGEFRLTGLPGGKTLVEGTSRYDCRFEPAGYWRLWTRAVVHAVHREVLGEIARQASGR